MAENNCLEKIGNSEIEHYLDANYMMFCSKSTILEFNILQWWKQKQSVYLLLAKTVKQM